MKNKKFLAVAAGLCLFATVGYANNYLISGLGFVAPSIIGKSNIYNPEVGEIVYDAADNTFYGFDQNNQWQVLNAGASTVPSGTIMAYGGAVAPAGYLLCNGDSYNKLTYSNLHAAIGNAFGGDANSFNVPDLRGRFLRGVAGDSTLDPGKNSRDAMNPGGNVDNMVGSIQGDEFKSHTHQQQTTIATGAVSGTSTGANGRATGSADPLFTLTAGGQETRPKNANVNFIIKI